MQRSAYILAAIGLLALLPESALAQASAPFIQINTDGGGGGDPSIGQNQVFAGLKLALLLSTIVFIPAVVMTTTCFTRIIIVLSLTRQALGTAQTPPNQVLLGLGLFLTIAVMTPVFTSVYNEAIEPYSNDQITHEEAFTKAFAPIRDFMLRHTREQDLELFVQITKTEMPDDPFELGPAVVIPAFLLSELNTAFQIGFLIFLPFLVLDMIVSSVLTSMSMITLPPTVISMPIKLMLFVVIDGWHLIIGNLVRSYHV